MSPGPGPGSGAPGGHAGQARGDGDGPVDVFVSATAWARFRPELTGPVDEAVATGRARPVRWWALADDGTTAPVPAPTPGAASPQDATAPSPEVLWLSNDVFYSPLRAPMSELALEAPGLRWVQSAAAGTDGPLFGGIVARGCRLTTSHVTAIPIAEYVVGAVLRHFQQPERWARAAARREWAHHDFREVHGTRWLIVGYGAIGSAVAERVQAFGARVTAVRRSPTGQEPVHAVVRPDQLADHVGSADVVVLAAPAGPDTTNLVDGRFLAAMAEGSVLVNVARGALVDEAALLAALDRARPELAVLDVAAEEPPPPDSELWDHPRIVLTPHSSGGGLGRYRRAAELFAANLARYAAGEPLVDEHRPVDAPTDPPTRRQP